MEVIIIIKLIFLAALNDVWIFNLPLSNWTELKPNNHDLFEARLCHSSTIVNDCIFIYGGMKNSEETINNHFSILSLNGKWTGILSYPWGAVYSAQADLTDNGSGQINGKVIWTCMANPKKTEEIGTIETEIVKGIFDSSSRMLSRSFFHEACSVCSRSVGFRREMARTILPRTNMEAMRQRARDEAQTGPGWPGL